MTINCILFNLDNPKNILIEKTYFKHYLLLKDKLSFTLKNIEYSKVIAHSIALVAFNQIKDIKIKNIIKDFFFIIDISTVEKSLCQSSSILISSIERNDYIYQIKQTVKDVNSIEVIHLSRLPKIFYFNPINIMRNLIFVITKTGNTISIKSILFLASRLTQVSSLHEQLLSFSEKNYLNKKIIAFNCAYLIENLICQFFIAKKLPTYSLVHYIVTDYKKHIPLDILNIENTTDSKILVWGESSKRKMCTSFNIPSNKIFVAGNPKYSNKSIEVQQVFDYCLVILGRSIYDESNFEILNIVKRLKILNPYIKVDIKLHLSLVKSKYDLACKNTNIKILDNENSLLNILENKKYNFCIVNNSTAYYEAMYHNMICFRYELSENEDFTGLDDKFSDVNSLMKQISKFSTMPTQELNTQIECLLIDTIGMGINKYKQILSNE